MKKSLLTILCTLLSLMSWAQNRADGTAEPYAVLTDNQDIISQDATGVTYGKTLTFYYDTNKSSYREAYGVGPFDNGETGRGWHEMRTQITQVSFDSSFADCTTLTSLAWWFSGMSNLVTIEGLANLNTSNVTDMWGMFEYCSSLSSLDLRTFDTRNVEKMAYMLDGCTSLQSLNISSFITSNVKEMGAMFQDCSSLPSLDVTGFDVQNNRSLWGTFAGLTVSSLDISSFNTAKVDDMGYMFARNPNLTTIYVGSGWTTASVAPSDVTGSVGGYDMFAGCTSLVGGAGTPYDANHVDETYAHIDGGATNPGYFTDKNAAPVVDEDLKDDVYTVGESDFSTEFYTQFSKYYQIPQGGKWVSKFKLNLNPNDNRIYKNFVLLITNDEDRGAGQYKEYGAFRYDAVADSTRTNSQWGTSYVFPFQYTTSTLYLEPDENEMDPNVQKLGGLVTLTVDRSQADAFVITMSNEQGVVKTYRQPYVLPNFNNDSTNTNIRCFITVENSQLEFKGSNIEPIGGYSAPVATVEPYAVLKGDTLLTFYYDDQKSVRGGIAFLDGTDVNWPSSITSVTQAFFDSSFAEFSPTSTANWFNGFTSLTTITGLEYLNTENVTTMESMFENCRSLTGLDMSNFKTDNVANMRLMFYNCTNLNSLDLSSFVTTNVTDMQSMFANCGSSPITIEGLNFNTERVTNFTCMFQESAVKTLDLSTFTINSRSDISQMFFGCDFLKTIYVGDGWGRPQEGSYIFAYCNELIGGKGTAFSSIAQNYQENGNDYIYAHIDGGSSDPGYLTDKNASYNEAYGVLVSENNTVSLTLYYDGNKNYHSEGLAIGLDEMMTNQQFLGNREYIQVVTIDSTFVHCELTATAGMFSEFSSLTAINDLKYLKTDKVTNMWRMFYACPMLSSLDVSGFNTANVTNMEAMFEGCSSLTSLDVSGFNTANVSTMRRMFMGCSALEAIDVSRFNTEKVTDMESMFESCGALRSINVSHFNTDNVANMGNMFVNCSGLTSLDVTNFNTVNVTNLFGTFSGCTGLTVLDLSSFNTAKVTDMGKTFLNCSSLTTIYAGSEWTTASVTEGNDPFGQCTSLVGGAGTPYDANHVDYTYARIDGGPNSTTPGYFTDKNAPITIAAPEFRFEGDNLTMTTETQDAGIFYKIADLPSMDEAVVDSVVNSLIVTADGQSTYYDQPFELKKAAVVKAIAIIRNETGTFASDTTTMVYDYEAWVNLKAAVSSGTDLYGRAQGNPNVDAQLLEQLQWALNEGDMIYNNRAQMDSFEATHFTQRINELCAQIEAQMTPSEHTVSVTAGANGSILYIIGTGTAAQEGEVPAESEVVLSIADKTQLELFPRPNDNYHWENVTLNDTINFNEYVQQNNAVIVLVDQDMKWKITFAENAPVQKVATPTFSFMNDFGEELTIQSETDGAEIYYRMNGRMLEEGDTDFASGSLRWSNWNVTGAHATGEFAYGSGIGYTDDYCLSLTNTVAGTSESAQATYTFKNALTQDGYYTLRFKARSQSGRGQLVAFCQNDTLPDTRSAEATFQIGSQYQDYSMMVRIPNANSNQIVLAFGTTVDTLFIDDVLFGPVISSTEGEMLTRYTGALNLDQGVTIEAIAKKDGMEDSKPAVFDYFYRGWRYLMEIFDYGRQITHQCYGDPNVPLDEVQKMEAILADMYSHYFERRGKEHVNDSELMSIYDEMSYRLHYLEQMRNGFTVDGVSYHAVDSTQVEVIPSLEGYYRGTITVPATVNYNNINFRVTTVAQNAFRSEYLTAIFWYAGFALTATDLQSSQNPNLLLYVTEASMAPTDRDNVVINGFAKNIRLSEGGNFHCPQAFTAEAISYTREFKQQTQIGVSRGWETIALPFTVQIIMHEARGLITPFGNSSSNTHFWLRRLTSNGLQAVPMIEANTAYLISMPNSEEYSAEFNLAGRVTFSAENAVVPMTEIVKDESADYVMIPVFENTAAKQGVYVLNVGEERNGYPEGSIFESNYRAVLPFQAYTEHKGSNPAPPYFIVGDLGGDTTGIDAILVNSERVKSEAWYTLDGRKLQEKPTQKGVYISNGKKVIIK